MIELLLGDCRETLAKLDAGSVQACVTSPPYWGLRDYGTSPLVWGAAEHTHEWAPAHNALWNPGGRGERSVATSRLESKSCAAAQGAARANGATMGSCCACGAWLGSLGLEPTPELYIEHLVECFRHLWRVLRDDGVLWLNLGDSYAGSGKGPTGHNGIGDQTERQGFHGHSAAFELGRRGAPRADQVGGYKPKDLLLLPFRVALALQADGWYLRSVIPWLKRAAMPESVRDRPTTAVEYVFLLAKSRRYYWDAAAVSMSVSGNAHGRGDGLNPKAREVDLSDEDYERIRAADPEARRWWPRSRPKQNASFSAAIAGPVSTRNRRNADWFFESWQGLLLDDDDDPLALVVNPAPYVGAHYATFPPRLVEPMVRASSREGDVVLDPFGGAGTVGLVADRLGRHAVLCELKPGYADQADARLVRDAPLFVSVQRRPH